ncbi:MAG: hypothetical protein FJ104_10760 [Deltaproteobacteria bacterium]|nr:hypothetical protein [Deltaproteobacteria bacterium]
MNHDKRERVQVTPELLGNIGESLKKDGPGAVDKIQAMLDAADDGKPPTKAPANGNSQAAADVKAGEMQAAQFKASVAALGEKMAAGRKPAPASPTRAPTPSTSQPRACGDRPSIFRR